MNMRAVAEDVSPGLTKLTRVDTGATVWMAAKRPEILFTYSEDHAKRWLKLPPGN